MDFQPDAKMFSSIFLSLFLYFIFIKQNVAPARCYPGLEAFIVQSDWHVVIQTSQMVKNQGSFWSF